MAKLECGGPLPRSSIATKTAAGFRDDQQLGLLHAARPRLTPVSFAAATVANWIVRNYEQRRAQIERYERQSLGAGYSFAGYYLPEDRDQESYDFSRVTDAGIIKLAVLLSGSRPRRLRFPFKRWKSLTLGRTRA
jgi:hypothetical protein